MSLDPGLGKLTFVLFLGTDLYPVSWFVFSPTAQLFRFSRPIIPMASFSTPSRDTLIVTAFMAGLVALGALYLGLRTML